MAEKKTTTKKVATPKKATAEKAPAKKVPVKKDVVGELYVNSVTAGFRAGDVYQALAASGKTMTPAEIAKATKLTIEEVLLGIGWLLKEGKIEGMNVADMRLV